MKHLAKYNVDYWLVGATCVKTAQVCVCVRVCVCVWGGVSSLQNPKHANRVNPNPPAKGVLRGVGEMWVRDPGGNEMGGGRWVYATRGSVCPWISDGADGEV